MRDQDIWIREATEDDVDGLSTLGVQVQSLHSEGRPDLFRPADPNALRDFFRGRLSAGSLVLVADRDDETLEGYVLAEILERPQSPFQYQHTAVYIHHIAVAEHSRRRGIGELLIAETVNRALQMGATAVRLDSWTFNADAHRFFEKLGFKASRKVFERPINNS